MKKLSEGRKMWMSVMAIFLVYAIIFILFEDYDRKFIMPFSEVSDWHLLTFSLVVMAGLGFLLFRYARRMDERISRDMGGTGLGLAIVKNAILLHGGTITISTPETGGLTFEFDLHDAQFVS